MTQKLICMTKKELSRYEIIKDLIAGKINGTDASKQIGVTIRHIKRLKLKVDNNGINCDCRRVFEWNNKIKVKG